MSERHTKWVQMVLHDLASGNYDLNKEYFGGNTILHILALVDSLEMLDGLDTLFKGSVSPPNLNATNIDGMTALTCACEMQRNQYAKALIKRGANPNIGNNKGVTALQWACNRGRIEIVRILLEAKANPDQVNISCKLTTATPLQMACKEKHIEIVQLLLEAGADPAIENAKGANALDSAILASSPQACMMLIYHHPCIVNTLRGSKQASIWHYLACEKTPLQMVRYFCKLVNTLIIVPIDQPFADNKRTALSFCIQNGLKDRALEFLQAGAQLPLAMHGLQTVPGWAIKMALAVKDQEIQRLRDQVDFVVQTNKKRRANDDNE